MELIKNEDLIKEIETGRSRIQGISEAVRAPFEKDFSLRFCWSSNAIEGNTLSLDETVSLIEYDEVRSGHTYTEYHDAKNLFRAIQEMLLPLQKREWTEEWLKQANGWIMGRKGEYRTEEVYIGSLAEAVYYLPAPEEVPEQMRMFFEKWKQPKQAASQSEIWHRFARQHIEFEQIHPFQDGNGRVGRMLLNQELINADFLPVAIQPTGKYRQAFLRYEKKGDLSLMVHQICKAELEAVERILGLEERRLQSRKKAVERSPKL